MFQRIAFFTFVIGIIILAVIVLQFPSPATTTLQAYPSQDDDTVVPAYPGPDSSSDARNPANAPPPLSEQQRQ